MVWFHKGELEGRYAGELAEIDTEEKLVAAIERMLLHEKAITKVCQQDYQAGYPTGQGHPSHEEERAFISEKIGKLIARLETEHDKEHRLVKQYKKRMKAKLKAA